ncbi:MAG: hypothetical protein JJLCMIEE_00905 [Acidimicrobiales bacterium]|nr:hypothetical protein [Acidimicrobiales bacterium]
MAADGVEEFSARTPNETTGQHLPVGAPLSRSATT